MKRFYVAEFSVLRVLYFILLFCEVTLFYFPLDLILLTPLVVVNSRREPLHFGSLKSAHRLCFNREACFSERRKVITFLLNYIFIVRYQFNFALRFFLIK